MDLKRERLQPKVRLATDLTWHDVVDFDKVKDPKGFSQHSWSRLATDLGYNYYCYDDKIYEIGENYETGLIRSDINEVI